MNHTIAGRLEGRVTVPAMMRRLTLVLFALTACKEPNGLDADPAIDAAAVVDGGLDAGLDGGRDATADAGLDSGSDAGTSDVEPSDVRTGPVTVRFELYGYPTFGEAIFHDADGKVLNQIKTSADGLAVADVPEGGMVTLVTDRFPDNSAELVTVVGVTPGETYRWNKGGIIEPLTVQITAGGEFPGAASYDYDFGCTAFTSTEAVALLTIDQSHCAASSPMTDVLVSARDPAGVLLAHQHAVVPPLVDGSVVRLDGDWATEQRTIEIRSERPEPNQLWMTVSAWLRASGPGGFAGLYSDPIDLWAPEVPLLWTVPAFGDSLQYFVQVDGLGGALYSSARWLDTIANFEVQLDFPAAVEPRLVARTGQPARPDIEWNAPGGGADVITLQLFTAAPSRLGWRIYVPADRTALQLPELPEDLAAVRPNSASRWSGLTTATAYSAFESYEAVRAAIGRSVNDWDFTQVPWAPGDVLSRAFKSL